MRVRANKAENGETKGRSELISAEERVAELRLRLTMLEREAEAHKVDDKFMKETLQRVNARNTEDATNLKRRITTLEREREDSLQTHMQESRALRSQLNDALTECSRARRDADEKDQELKLLTDTIESEGDAGDKEIEKLRLEKGQLLYRINSLAAHADQKVREGIAASAGKREAELILEREGKRAAEVESDNMRAQMTELETTLSALRDGRGGGVNGSEEDLAAVGKLKMDLDSSLKEAEVLRVQNAELTRRLTTGATDYEQLNRSNTILSERVKISELRLKQVEAREEESKIRLERARIRDEGADISSMFSPSRSFVGLANQQSQSILFERVISELQRDIDESRASFAVLEQEHEDLLALLAQQQIEKECMVGLLGEEGKAKAISQAEQLCVERFNQYIEMA